MKSNGSKMTWVVPSRYGVFSWVAPAHPCARDTCESIHVVTDVAVRRKRQALRRDRRSTDVTAQPLELLALMRSRRNASVQGKSSNLADSVIEGLVTGRQRLEGEHLATLLRPNGDTVGGRRTQELLHRTGLEVIPGQVAVLRILFQQPLAFEVATNAHCQCLGQSGQLGAGRCLHPVETQRAIGTLDLNSVQEQHMEMDIQIQCAAKALNQGDRAGLSRPTREPGLPDRVRGDTQLPARCLSCLPDRTALCRQRLVRQGYADIPDDRGRRQLEGALWQALSRPQGAVTGTCQEVSPLDRGVPAALAEWLRSPVSRNFYRG